MDRVTVYFGPLAQETDILKTGQFAMVGLAKLSADVLGTVTNVAGFTCIPTGPASLNVILTPGEIYQAENLEQSVWSSLPADSVHTIVKQGLLLDPATLAITPPGTIGFSQVYLIEVQYSDVDSGSVVLPYFNAANPATPFTGPGNSGTAQNTIRKGVCAVQIKAGTAASTGTQVAPTQDAGWTGIFLVTVANGQTTITSGNIVQVPAAPFIPVTLPLVPAGVQNGTWVYATDTGALNAMVAAVTPLPGGLVPGLEVRIKAATTNTGATTFNLNGLGASAVHRANGAALSAGDINVNMVVALVWDGSAWQIQNYFGFTASTTNNNTFTLTIPYVVDSGAVNALVASFSPAITGPSAGQFVEVKAANTNTAAATLNPNGLGAAAIVHADGTAVVAGDIQAGGVLLMVFDGTHWQLVSSSDLIIDAPVTFTVHGGGATFADLNIAFEYLSRYTISHNGKVTLQLAAGQFTYTVPVIMDHPNNSRIAVQGATMLAACPTTDAGYTISGFAGRVADTATNLTMLRTKFATELDFTSCHGLIVTGTQLGNLDGLLIVGNNTASTAGLSFECGGPSQVINTAGGVFAQTANGLAVVTFGQCNILCQGARVVFNAATPIVAIGGGTIASFASWYGSCFHTAGNIISLGGNNVGIDIEHNSMVDTGLGSVYADCHAGLGAQLDASRLFTNGGHFYKNGSWGAGLFVGSSANLPNCDFGAGGANANTSGSLTSSGESGALVTGATNYTATCSPAVNVVGNANAIITF